MKKIVYRLDGETRLVNPSPQFVAAFENEDDAIAYIRTNDVPAGALDITVVEEQNLPDTYFFGAWRITGGRVDVDLPEARKIRLATIARVRREILGEQDDEIFKAKAVRDALREARAVEKRRKAEEVADKIDLDTINSPSDLRNYWPVDIERRLAARGR